MIDKEAKLNKDLCERFPFLLPYSALKESEDDDLLPRTDCVDPDLIIPTPCLISYRRAGKPCS